MFSPTGRVSVPVSFIEDVRALVQDFRRGDCWCEKGIGNPMMADHDKGCKTMVAIRAALDKLDGKE